MKNLEKPLLVLCFILLATLLTSHTTEARTPRNPNSNKLIPITTTVSPDPYGDNYTSVTVNGKQVGRKDGTTVLDVPNWKQTKIAIRTKSGKLGSCALPRAVSAGTNVRIYYGRAGYYSAVAGEGNSCVMQTVAPPKEWRQSLQGKTRSNK